MTSWLSKTTLQKLLDLTGLHFTTSERSGPSLHSMLHNFLSRPLSFLGWTTAMFFWLDFHQAQSNLYRWFRMQQHDWSSANSKGPMLHLSLSPCTGYRLQLESSSRHWCLHIEQPQAQHRLLPLTYNNLHHLKKSEICERATPCSAITERYKITRQNVFIHRSWVVEWTSHPHLECWIPDNFQGTPEN